MKIENSYYADGKIRASCIDDEHGKLIMTEYDEQGREVTFLHSSGLERHTMYAFGSDRNVVWSISDNGSQSILIKDGENEKIIRI